MSLDHPAAVGSVRADRLDVAGAGGIELVLHRWRSVRPRAAVFYVHGIQSHGGWLFETGPELARRGVSTYLLDRRGSGMSGGSRGYLPDALTVVDDHAHALELVRADTAVPLTGLGQSFGGSVLAALLVQRPDSFDSVVFTAPAIGQQRARHEDSALAARRLLDGAELRAVPLDDRDYTDDPGYLRFMADDPLMLREVPARTLATMVELEDRYLAVAEWNVTVPVALALPAQDRIIDLAVTQRELRTRIPGLDTVRFGAAQQHYLEFTPARHEYWDWLAHQAVSRGVRDDR